LFPLETNFVKSLRALKAAGLILAAVVLGLMTVQGSYALWNAAVTATPGTVQSADFNILVNNVNMATTPSLNVGELTPGKPAYVPLMVTNAVNVTADSPLVLQASVTGLNPVNTFEGNLTVKSAVIQGAAVCTPELPYAAGAPQLPVLGIKATQTICFKVELSGSTPAQLLGAKVEIPVSLSVAQVAPAAAK
jgi:predicted ribosomally synthesized peptide with SipW-like signal peptide